MSSPDAAAGRRRFFGAAALGSLLALLLDAAMLSAGDASPVRPTGLLGSFFDVQGHAFLHGHLAVPLDRASFEGFQVGGRTYLYFGPVPTLLRLPVLAVTHSLDGRLTVLSMLLAFVVLLASGAILHWRVRRLVRPAAAVAGIDVAAAFLLQVALGAGSIALFLASWAVVYHEVELWGAALAIAALTATLGVLERPALGRIAVAGALAALAVNTRVSVGLGPILALGVLGLGAAAAELAAGRPGRVARAAGVLARLWPPGAGHGRRVALGLFAAALVALALSAAINEAKFHRPFGIPIDKQVDTRIDPPRRAVLAANGGHYFGVRFVPSTLLASVRPDALGTLRAFPFIGLPTHPPRAVGDVTLDRPPQSLSALTSMTLFCALTLVGIVWLARRRRWPWLAVLAAAAGGYAATLTIATYFTRYLADALPFLLLGAQIGLQALLAAGGVGTPARRPRWGPVVLIAVAVLTLVGIAVNGSVGLFTQRLLAPGTARADRAAFVRTQDDVDRFLGRGVHGVRAGPELPARAAGAPGDLFVLDRCAALYAVGFDRKWVAVERTERDGVHRLDVRFPAGAAGPPAALLTVGSGARRLTVTARPAGPGRALLALRVGGRTVATGRAVHAPADRPARVEESFDSLNGATYASVRVDGRTAVLAVAPYDRRATATAGADPEAPGLRRFAGTVRVVSIGAPVCTALARRARLAAQ